MKYTVSTVSVKYSVSTASVKYSISTVSVKCSVSTVSAQRQRSTTSMKYTYRTVTVKYSAKEALCQYSISEEHCQCSTPSVTITITTILYSSQREIKAAVRSHEQYNCQGIVYSRYSALSPQNRICLAPQREQTATVHPHREKQKKDQREKKPCSSFRCLPT